MLNVDVNSPAARALRALQKYDQVALQKGAEVLFRALLIEAESALGELLGLECSGEHEGGPHYDHAGDTCPVHEWLEESDEAEAERLRELVPSRDPSLLSDEAALDQLNLLLSAPEWPGASGMEDVCAIVRRTGRVEVPDAPVWPRH